MTSSVFPRDFRVIANGLSAGSVGPVPPGICGGPNSVVISGRLCVPREDRLTDVTHSHRHASYPTFGELTDKHKLPLYFQSLCQQLDGPDDDDDEDDEGHGDFSVVSRSASSRFGVK